MRFHRLFILGPLLACAAAFPLTAQGAPAPAKEKEIVYRTNLGRADDIRLLIEQGADVNQTDDKGVPLLCLAAGRSDKESVNVMKALLDAGADVNGKDGAGQNALFYAARRNNEDAVQLLLERKINYYAVDNNGDIARTIAFREGYTNIVSQMDNFVKGETAKITEQYRELEKILAEQYKAQEEDNKKATSAATRDALEESRKLREAQENETRDAEAQIQGVADKRNSAAFKQDQYNLSFHACGFEYWSFCQSMRQTSDLDDNEMTAAVRSHKDEVVGLNDRMVIEYSLRKKYMDRIISDSKQSVYDQLTAMPSKTYRFEHGVCKMKDMIARCQDIAENGGHYSSQFAPITTLPNGSNNGGGLGNKGKKDKSAAKNNSKYSGAASGKRGDAKGKNYR